MDAQEINRALDTIADADPIEAAKLTTFALRRLGYHGRPAAQALLEGIQAEHGPDSELVEGFEQISAVEGVITGRTDQL